jgi:hypothetical protein
LIHRLASVLAPDRGRRPTLLVGPSCWSFIFCPKPLKPRPNGG